VPTDQYAPRHGRGAIPNHPLTKNTVEVLLMQDENATVATVTVPWGRYATGSSKRAPGDPKDYGRAYRLAVARAMIRLGRTILHDENGRAY